MNKTLTVNIGGMVFHIEEHAYEKMKKYIDSVKMYFKTADGGEEIMQDVESRIAEILTERLGGGRQVVNEDDVKSVIDTMGRPEQFASEEDLKETTFASNIQEGRKYRKLYRDPDDKILGGVCSGLAHRLGIDPLWMRLIFVVSFFLWGFSLIIYIILAIIIPKAETTSQKLEMKGEEVTINSLQKAAAVTEEKKSNFLSRFFETIGTIIKTLFKVIFYIAAAFIALISLIVLFALFMAVMAMMGVAGISIPIFISDLFLTSSQMFWAILAMILVIGIPVIALLFAGIKALFGIKYKSRFLNIAAVILITAGVIIAFAVGTDIAREFQAESKVKTEIPLLTPETDTLFVGLMHDAQYGENVITGRKRFGFYFGNKFTVLSGDDENILPGHVTLDIIKADGDKFELIQTNIARGLTEKQAFENARSILYNMEQKDSLLSFSNYFPINEKIKYRGQKVKLLLKVPVGKHVHLLEGSEHIIYDIENTTNTYDGDMVGHTWTMTSKGLECLSCSFNHEENDIINSNGKKVLIKRKRSGIYVNGKQDSLVITGDDEVKISIDENGIVIKKK
jgi:phage shock protein PspC (stress-responsive transcriptional regulator)